LNDRARGVERDDDAGRPSVGIAHEQADGVVGKFQMRGAMASSARITSATVDTDINEGSSESYRHGTRL
jgi:hypothetical protein